MIVNKPKKTKRKYFTKDTENAIIKYNNETNPDIKSRIFERHIHYPLYKLTQNIIHTFNFYHTDVKDLEHLQHEIIIFVLSKMDKYSQTKNVNDKIRKIFEKEYKINYDYNFIKFVNDADIISQKQINSFINLIDSKLNSKLFNNKEEHEEFLNKLKKIKVPKAYSYFGTIVKRWLITYNKKHYNKKINNVKIQDLSPQYNEHIIQDTSNSEQLDNFIDHYIEYCTQNIYQLFPKNNEAQVADAILEVFRKREDLEIFNKKAIYIYIREIIDVKTPKITKVAKKLKKIFTKNYDFYLSNGYVDFYS